MEIQSLFNAQIKGVMKQTMEQLDWLSDNGMTDQVVCPRTPANNVKEDTGLIKSCRSL
jgi:hypothetical protein